uniref:Uncharacterized protein n=1 Tax=Fagus sylvatica TaxID=28930 RepID=A0A2N9HBP1_FAGSY
MRSVVIASTLDYDPRHPISVGEGISFPFLLICFSAGYDMLCGLCYVSQGSDVSSHLTPNGSMTSASSTFAYHGHQDPQYETLLRLRVSNLHALARCLLVKDPMYFRSHHPVLSSGRYGISDQHKGLSLSHEWFASCSMILV